MPKIKIIFLITFLFVNFFVFREVEASGNISGWAWSENIGWISFNCLNQNSCATIDYGVNIDPQTKIFSGYAWSENIGWITFNEAELSGCPISPCRAWLGSDNKVYGWARALAYGGGWDGWISLRNDSKNYGVWLDTSTSPWEFRGFAWSDMVIGWISFNCKDVSCSTSNYKVFLTAPLNQPPTANNLSVDAQSSDVICGETEGSRAKFSWNFVDPDPGDSQSAYQIQIDNNSDFSVDTGKILSSSQTFLLSRPYPLLNWGTTYYWRLMVWDSHDAPSTWIIGPSFTTPSHSYPTIDFSWDPQKPKVGEVVQFTDLSVVYGGTTKSSWYWEFPAGTYSCVTPTTNCEVAQNPAIKFLQIPQYPNNKIYLTVTDSDGFYCRGEKSIVVTYPLPFFKEIPPIFFRMREILASLISKFRPF